MKRFWFLTLIIALLSISVGFARTLEDEKEFKNSYTTNASTAQSFYVIQAADGTGLNIKEDGGTSAIFVEDGGNVGIGNTDPTVLLDVSGTIQGSTIQGTTGAFTNGTFTNALPAAQGGTGNTSLAATMAAMSTLLTNIDGLAPSNGEYLQFLSSTTVQKITTANLKAQFGMGDMADQTSSSVSITGGSITGITDLAVADGGTGASTDSDARVNLNVEYGVDVLAYDAGIQSLADLTNTDGYLIRQDGTGYERQTTAAHIAALGLTPGTDVLAYDADVQSLSDLAPNAGDFLKFDGSNTYVAVSTATLKTHLAYGTMADQADSSVDINGGAIDGAIIGANSAAAGTFSDLTVNGTLTAGGIAETWLAKRANYQLAEGENVSYDSADNAIWLTAVASAGLTTGSRHQFLDVGDNASTNNVHIDPDGSDLIEGLGTTVDISSDGSSFDLVWTGNAAIGWRLVVHK
jgi:hypothetical protein